MRAVNSNWQPRNRIMTPLAGAPAYINSGIIKAVMNTGEKISVAQIDYQEFDEENFQYIISPYWEIVDGLPAAVFQGIPGIDIELRLKDYYRVNYIPTFIAERTPSENREDLWELLGAVGLDYYDRFEWLLRTNLRSGNDNLIVERRRMTPRTEKYSFDILAKLQYGDKVVVESLDTFASTTAEFSNAVFTAVTNGIDIVADSGQVLIDSMARGVMVSMELSKRMLQRREQATRQQEGIERARREGKYLGRKPIAVDEEVLRQVATELEEGLITVEDAMERTKISSRSTFYRKLRSLKQ